MKKCIALLLAAVVLLPLAACGDNGTVPPTASIPTETQAVEVDRAVAESEIRCALSLLVDRNYIAEEIARGRQTPAASFVAMGITDMDGSAFCENAGYSQDYIGYYDSSKEGYEDNFAKAYTILTKYYHVDKNGMLTDFPPLTYSYCGSEEHKAIGEFLQTVFATVGIDLQLENQRESSFRDSLKEGGYTMACNVCLTDCNDPISFLNLWTSGSGSNAARFGKGDHAAVAAYDLDLTGYGYAVQVEDGTWAETYDVLISRIQSCTDARTRYALMHLAEDMLMSTGCITPLYFCSDLYMLDESVEGFFTNPLGGKYFLRTTVNGRGDAISVCLGSEPQTLDPARNSTVDDATLVSHLFAGLAKWDQDENGRLVIVPDCAEALAEGVPNDDGTVTYTYTLREGLKWSDGQNLTAHDFEFAWKRAASAEFGADYGYLFDAVKGYGSENADDLAVKALDDRILVVTLNDSISYWNELLASPVFSPVRRDVVENQAWATDPSTYVSNGAYTMTGWDHNTRITLTKNQYFHGADDVTMNEIRFCLSDNADEMMTNFQNGSWQMIGNVPTGNIASWKAAYPNALVANGQIGTCYICWNINKPLLP